ncbi:MAG: LacI family DNA-binding transcriptional regulator [Turicibacter sp.]
MKKKVTMQAIADELGITKVTVSRALSDSEGVGEELRDRIKQKAREMGYLIPSPVKTLQLKGSGLIGILVPEVFLEKDENFYTRLYKNLYTALDEANYLSVLNVISKQDEMNGVLPKVCQTHIMEGIIVLGQLEREYVEMLNELDIPIVLVDFYYRGIEIDSVITDNVYAMYEMTNYLVERGHSKIGFVGNIKLTSSIQDRYLGFCKSMLEHNLDVLQECVLADRDLAANPIDILLPEVLPSAFVCNSDQAARRLIELLQSKNILVPEEVSVVGFDDVWHSLMVNPKITTVKVQRREMAKYTVSRLIEQMSTTQKLVTRRIVVPTEIVERDSVKRF